MARPTRSRTTSLFARRTAHGTAMHITSTTASAARCAGDRKTNSRDAAVAEAETARARVSTTRPSAPMAAALSEYRPSAGKETFARHAASCDTTAPLYLIASRSAGTVQAAPVASSRTRTSTREMPSLIHASPTTVVSRGTAMPAIGACIRMPCGRIRSANITAWMP